MESSNCLARRVYIDLGTNWCGTIMQYREHELPPQSNDRSQIYAAWEVYGFEASPLIQPYVEEYMTWLDGRRATMPVLCVPPSSSSKQLAKWAPIYECPASPAEDMRQCMWRKLAPHLAALKPNPRLNRSSLVEARLRIAHRRRCPQLPTANSRSFGNGTRFTFIPAIAAPSSEGEWMRIWSPAGQTIRGGGLTTSRETVDALLPPEAMSNSTAGWYKVLVADVSSWLIQSFAPKDHVVLRMDIEGSEHALLREMIKSGAIGLVDHLHFECRAKTKKQCAKLKDAVLAANPSIKVQNDASRAHQQNSSDSKPQPDEKWSKRMAACSAAVAGDFTLYQSTESSHGTLLADEVSVSMDDSRESGLLSPPRNWGSHQAAERSQALPLAHAESIEARGDFDGRARATVYMSHANHRAWHLHFVYEPFIRTLINSLSPWFRMRIVIYHERHFPNATRGDIVVWLGQWTISAREFFVNWEELKSRGIYTVYYQTEPLPPNRTSCWSTRSAAEFCSKRIIYDGIKQVRCKWPPPFTTDEVWDYSRANVARSCPVSRYLPPGFNVPSYSVPEVAVAGPNSSFFFGRSSNRKPECLRGLEDMALISGVFTAEKLAKTLRRYRTLVNLHKSHKIAVGCTDMTVPFEAARLAQVLSAGPVHVVSERSNPLDECMYEGIVTFASSMPISAAADVSDEDIRERRQLFMRRFEPSRLLRASRVLEGWCARFGNEKSASRDYCEWLNFSPRIEHCTTARSEPRV